MPILPLISTRGSSFVCVVCFRFVHLTFLFGFFCISHDFAFLHLALALSIFDPLFCCVKNRVTSFYPHFVIIWERMSRCCSLLSSAIPELELPFRQIFVGLAAPQFQIIVQEVEFNSVFCSKFVRIL